MKRAGEVPFIVGLLTLSLVFGGYNVSQAQAADPQTSSASVSVSTLGSLKAAEPFQVMLVTEPATPTMGKTLFKAKVMRDGKPVTHADIRLNLTMPSMQMQGPELMLKKVDDHYEGTANLNMAGEWRAEMTVKDVNETGTAKYNFTAK